MLFIILNGNGKLHFASKCKQTTMISFLIVINCMDVMIESVWVCYVKCLYCHIDTITLQFLMPFVEEAIEN